MTKPCNQKNEIDFSKNQENKNDENKNQKKSQTENLQKTKYHKAEKKNEPTSMNKDKNICVMYANVDSLTNKMNEIETYVEVYKADIILISEHLSKNSSSNFSDIFKLHDYTCLEDNTGRGVCLFYKNYLNVSLHNYINDLYKPSLFINISEKESTPINLGLVYRSPSNDEKENKKLIHQMNFATKKLKNLTIFGDFNHPYIDWEYHYCKKPEYHCDSLFLFEVTKLDLNQLVTEYTHFKPNCKPSLIDLILTRNPNIVCDIKHHPPIAKSHHSVLTAKLKTTFTKQNVANSKRDKIIKPNFEKANYSAINQQFSDYNWENMLNELNVNEAWDLIKLNIYQAQNSFVPNKIINPNKSRPNAVSMDDTLHFLLKNKRYYFKIYKKYRTATAFMNYNNARNQVSRKIKNMKKLKENKIAKNIKTNPKAFYQYIASKTIKKESISDLVKDDGNLTSNDEEKCNVINNFFASVFTHEDMSNVPDFVCNKNIETSLETCFIETHEMESALLKLNPNKSPGPDNLHPHFLKNTAKSLSLPLTILFHKTLSEGSIPDDWKVAEVRPIFKKGDKSLPGNYRPVSLTSVICKVFESFIKKSLNNHLIQNNLLCNEQFGFVSGRNTVTQLLVTLNDWMAELDSNTPVDAAYMDFCKAFDSVPHQRLISKLKGYNINGQILNWIISFLSNRSQFVKINNSSSNNVKVTSGVPQGSVLGPTLFIYFINDLPSVVNNCNVKVFADDTKVYKSIENEHDVECLQNAIDSMFEWTQKWLLKFNKDKCKILHLGKNNQKHQYTIGNTEDKTLLDETDLEKDLGVFIDPNLDFKKHIKNTVKKASYSSCKIIKNFTYKTSSTLVPLFKTLVRPILEYANNVWSNGQKKYMTKIENVQRKYSKHINGLSNIPYEERLRRIKLPSLEFRQLRGDMLQVYKIAHNFYDPQSTSSIFNFSNDTRLRGHNFKIIKQRVNKSKFANFFTNRVINSWNSLPHNVVNAKTINEFKNLFDKHKSDIMYKININD